MKKGHGVSAISATWCNTIQLRNWGSARYGIPKCFTVAAPWMGFILEVNGAIQVGEDREKLPGRAGK
jgi:hypothetical protein